MNGSYVLKNAAAVVPRWIIRCSVFAIPFFLLSDVAVGQASPAQRFFYHTADTSGDWHISLSELLRVVQFYNGPNSYYYYGGDATEDGFAAVNMGLEFPWWYYHDADFGEREYRITLSELLRVIQLYNSPAYARDMTQPDTFTVSDQPPDYAEWFSVTVVTTNIQVWDRNPLYADFTADGLPDIVLSKEGDGLYLYENTGSRSFVGHLLVAGENLRVAIAGDGDDDGDMDVMYRIPDGAGGWDYWYLENEGGGTFGAAARMPASPATYYGLAAPADLDGDGREDLLAETRRGWYRNTGPFAYGEYFEAVPTTLPPGWDVPQPQCPEISKVELNDDGAPDLFGKSYAWRITSPEGEGFDCEGEPCDGWYCGDDQFLVTLTNQGDGAFNYNEIEVRADYGEFQTTNAGDIDGSSSLDCFVTYGQGEALVNAAVLGLADAEPTTDLEVGPGWIDDDALAYPDALADVDGDGDADLILWDRRELYPQNRQYAGWVENVGGRFENDYCLASNCSHVSVCDFDQDGLLDFVLISPADWTLFVLWNDMPGDKAGGSAAANP